MPARAHPGLAVVPSTTLRMNHPNPPMTSISVPGSIVSTVTAHYHETEGPILIGHGKVAWNDRPKHTECLINSHFLRNNDVMFDDVTMRDGGKKNITINGTEVKLDLFDEKKLSFNIRTK